MKKVLSVLVVLAMVLSLPLGAFAAGPATAPAEVSRADLVLALNQLNEVPDGVSVTVGDSDLTVSKETTVEFSPSVTRAIKSITSTSNFNFKSGSVSYVTLVLTSKFDYDGTESQATSASQSYKGKSYLTTVELEGAFRSSGWSDLSYTHGVFAVIDERLGNDVGYYIDGYTYCPGNPMLDDVWTEWN
jgi:hypothetical protein